jgi:hypothetical protein
MRFVPFLTYVFVVKKEEKLYPKREKFCLIDLLFVCIYTILYLRVDLSFHLNLKIILTWDMNCNLQKQLRKTTTKLYKNRGKFFCLFLTRALEVLK